MSRISSFIHFDARETLDREYFISHTSLKRFRVHVIGAMALAVFLLIFPGTSVLVVAPQNKWIGLLGVVPGIIVVLYFCFRTLKISYGYATLTNDRIIYYEYNAHVAENYHFVKSLHLADITAMQFRIERTWFRKSFYMAVFTEFKALVVGGEGWLGILKIFSKSSVLEPGPDALEFIQQMAGQIAWRKMHPELASKMSSG